jgi:hypothetical protein
MKLRTDRKWRALKNLEVGSHGLSETVQQYFPGDNEDTKGQFSS